MAIDQRDVSSTLRFMDDRALQQYAAMHKNDPYIFPLAFQESQNRQRLRMQQQGAQGMQPQPKVADAALAQMAPPQAQPMPETQGIGALPAPNMKFGAEGGIMGYDDDANFAARSEPVVMMADGGVARYQAGGNIQSKYQQESQEMGMGTRTQYSPDVQAFVQEQAQASKAEEQAYLKQEQQRMLRGPYGNIVPTVSAAPVSKATMPEPGYTRPGMVNDPRLATPRPASAPVEERDAAPRADTTRQARPDAGLAAIAAPKAAPEQSAAQRYAQMQKDMGTGPEASADVEWKRAQLADRMRAQSKGELEEFDKEAAARGEAFKGREERLAKREAGLGKQKDENTGLALLEAGLAIMSTPGSLATAIGKGAQTGLKTYGAGLEKLRAAQEKMDDARDQIEEFRRNEANMTAKERRQFKNQINKTETEIEKLGVDAAEKMFGYKREDAKNVFTADTQERLTKAEIASKERVANAQISATLNTPERQLWADALKKHGGDTSAAFKEMQSLKAEKFNPYQSYADYLKAFAGKDTTLTPPQDFAKYASQFTIPTTTAPAKGATVLKQP
jgi:hypothetical protein